MAVASCTKKNTFLQAVIAANKNLVNVVIRNTSHLSYFGKDVKCHAITALFENKLSIITMLNYNGKHKLY